MDFDVYALLNTKLKGVASGIKSISFENGVLIFTTKDDVVINVTVPNMHTHSNKDLLDKLSVIDGKLYYDGKLIDGHSHDNKSELDKIVVGDKAKIDSAYTHSTSSHAPSTAQKNSDITKAEIEAKLTGDVSSHTHSGYSETGHRHDASEIDNLPSGGGGGSTVVVDNLTSTSTTSALSANQGRVIKSQMDNIATQVNNHITNHPSGGTDVNLDGVVIADGIDYTSEQPLYLDDFSGYRQPYHPSVLYFKNGFGGYKYWLAQTPFPIGGVPYRDRWESPCIYCSNDGIQWTVKANPLDDITQVEIDGKDYLSDPHLVFANGKLECWYRYTDVSDNNHTWILRKTTNDGVTWGARETLIDCNVYGMVRSQSIIFENGKYRIWYTGQGTACDLGYTESADAINWGSRTACTLDNSTVVWHHDVKIIKGKYYLLSYSSVSKKIELFESNNGLNFTFKKLILQPSGTGFYKTGLYRACILETPNELRIYFSCDDGSRTYIGLMVGTTFDDMKIVNGSKLTYRQLKYNGEIFVPKTDYESVFVKNETLKVYLDKLELRVAVLEGNTGGSGGDGGGGEDNTDGLILSLSHKDVVTSNTGWLDHSTRQNNGTLTNITHDGTFGKIASGLRFDGVDDHILFSKPLVDTIAHSFTFEVSFVPNTTSTQTRLLSINWVDCIWTSGSCKFTCNSQAHDILTSVTVGTTYRIAIVYDSSTSTLRMYNNGQQVGTDKSATITGFLSPSRALVVGAFKAGTDSSTPLSSFSQHTIKSIKIYNKALTGTEILADYNADLVANP